MPSNPLAEAFNDAQPNHLDDRAMLWMQIDDCRRILNQRGYIDPDDMLGVLETLETLAYSTLQKVRLAYPAGTKARFCIRILEDLEEQYNEACAYPVYAETQEQEQMQRQYQYSRLTWRYCNHKFFIIHRALSVGGRIGINNIFGKGRSSRKTSYAKERAAMESMSS